MRRVETFACAVALLTLTFATGCGRHVVIDPSAVPARNDPDWIVRATPPTVTTSASQQAQPGPTLDASR